MAENAYALPNDYAARYGPWAVIAGGSEGTGESFARQLASAGIHVVLLARREAPLRKLAEAIRADYGVEARYACIDLTAPDIVEQVRKVSDDVEVGLFIFNAGSNIAYERFDRWAPEKLAAMIGMNCHAPVHLAHHFVQGMVERGRGGLMFLSSMAAMSGAGLMAIYPATKAFDQMFAEGLWQDLKPVGVDALALVLGATNTPSHAHVDFAALGANLAMECDDAAHEGLMHLGKGPLWVTGEQNRKLLPKGFIESRAPIIDGGTRATAMINGREHISALD